MKQSGFSMILILLGVLIIAVLLIGGAYYLGTLKNSESVVQNSVVISPLPTPLSSPSSTDEAVNWRIYKNKLHSFSVEIPANWEAQVPEVSTDNFRMGIIKRVPTSSANTNATGDYTPGIAYIDLIVNADSAQKVINETVGVNKTEQIYIDGNVATRLTGTSGVAGSVNFVTIVLPHNGKTFIFSFSTQDASMEQQALLEFDQFLPTFKFTK